MKLFQKEKTTEKTASSTREALIFLVVFIGFFCAIGSVMGATNMLNTLMNTAFDLLLNTVFYIMAVAVLAGAIGALLSEFGVIALINRILSPLMKPVYDLPGAASVGVVTTYLSDNPAILSLAHDKKFRRFFKKYQLPALTNIGTAFGMGAIISVFMLGIKDPSGGNFALAVIIGNFSAILGSIVSTRLMIRHTKKLYGPDADCDPDEAETVDETETADKPRQGAAMRFMNAVLEGGKSGVAIGLDIIPGVLIICTLVMMLTYGPGAGGVYTGGAYEGVGFLPWIGEKLSFLLSPLFGFTDPAGIAVPITALGSSGAAMGVVPGMVQQGIAKANDIAVFTAMCMCWSGYLSTHVAMMDNLKSSHLIGRAILSHTVGGLCAGVAANWIFRLVTMII